jgi:hypothetical protein
MIGGEKIFLLVFKTFFKTRQTYFNMFVGGEGRIKLLKYIFCEKKNRLKMTTLCIATLYTN